VKKQAQHEEEDLTIVICIFLQFVTMQATKNKK